MSLTWVEIDKLAINFNIAQFKKIIGREKFLMPVVKSNAYGHGMVEVAKICDVSTAVDRICVASDDEALTLISAGIKKPIMILSFYDSNDENKICLLASGEVIFAVYRRDQITALSKAGERVCKKIRVHLKIDTGTSRVGVLPNEALSFAEEIAKEKFLSLEGVWSHYASSESDRKYTAKQNKIFKNTLNNLETNGFKIPIKHMACSAATILTEISDCNAARVGLGTYGLHPSKKTNHRIKLKPALSWHTRIIQVKTLPKGSKISYGGTYTAKKNIKIAVLPVGYGDGYDRKLSNTGHVLVRGKKCPVRGRVCMNLCMIDITALKNVKAGEQVTLIGQQGKSKVTAEDLANCVGTINYEIVDRINSQIPRIYRNEYSKDTNFKFETIKVKSSV